MRLQAKLYDLSSEKNAITNRLETVYTHAVACYHSARSLVGIATEAVEMARQAGADVGRLAELTSEIEAHVDELAVKS